MLLRNILVTHVIPGDTHNGRYVDDVRYLSGEVLLFYRNGGQQTFPSNARVTVNR